MIRDINDEQKVVLFSPLNGRYTQPMTGQKQSFFQNVWKVVANIPPGQVMSYGEVARAAGFAGNSRRVSTAMRHSPTPLPWYRVLRSDRKLAFEPGSEAYQEQLNLLIGEGARIEGQKIITENSTDTLDRLLWGPLD